MKTTKILVRVEKTLQVERFEPVSVTLQAEAELEEDDTLEDSYKELYVETSKQAKRFIQNELTKHLMEVENNRDGRSKKGVK
jgi:hypothetical protein